LGDFPDVSVTSVSQLRIFYMAMLLEKRYFRFGTKTVNWLNITEN